MEQIDLKDKTELKETFNKNFPKNKNQITKNWNFVETILQNMPMVIYSRDKRNHLVHITPYCQKLLGYSPEELVENPELLLKAVHQDDKQKIMNSFNETVTIGSFSEEYRIIHKLGEMYWVNDSNFAVFNSEGELERIDGIIYDITPRKMTEKALVQITEALTHLIDTANAPIFGIDLNAYINEWNQKMEVITGHNKEIVLGKNFVESFIPETYHSSVEELLHKALRGEETQNYELSIFTKTTKKTTLLLSSTTRQDSSGNIIGAIFVGQDITERRRAEEALRESEIKHRLLLNSIRSPILALKEDMTLLYCNDAFIHLVERAISELEEKNLLTLIPEFRNTKWFAVYLEVLESGETKETEGKFKDKYLHSTIYRTPWGILAIIEDISKQKEAQEQINKLSRAVEQGSSSIVITDVKGNIEYVNPKFVEQTGYLFEEVRGTKLQIMKSGNLTFEDNKKLWDTILSGEEWRKEYYNKKKNGEFYWDFTSISPIRNEEDEISHFLLITEDITERKRMEEELAKSRDLLAEQVTEKTRDLLEEKKRVEAIINAVSDGILVLDVDGNLSLMNQTFKKYYREIFGEEISKGINCYSITSNNFMKTIQRLFVSKKPQSVTIEPKSGLFLQFVSAIQGDPSKPYFSTIIEIRDVTPFIELDNLRKKFVSTVSHELRTPISVIDSSLDILDSYKEQLSQEEKTKLMDAVHSNTKLLVELIEDLLMISRIDDKRIELIWETCQPSQIIESILNQSEPSLKVKNIDVDIYIDPDTQLLGDIKRLGQVFRIFIDNAIKYSDAGAKITIEAIDQYQGQYNPQKVDGLLIKVSDTGKGIRKEDLPYLFDRFFRSDSVIDISGTGLGLSIAKELVALHAGRIFVESEYGKGSTFIVFLPRLSMPFVKEN